MKKMALLVFLSVLCVPALATTVSYNGDATFNSDLNPNGTITLASFDTSLGTLNSVRIDIKHLGSVTIAGDNDDPLKSGMAEANMIRTFDVIGSDLVAAGAKTINGGSFLLEVDNGDLALFDSSPADGHNWGSLAYGLFSAGSYFPDMSGYQTAGPGTVGFTVDPTAMVNYLSWVTTPDSWQMEVENPILTVNVKVAYDYTPIPEPATLSLLGLSFVGLVVRRRKA